MRTKPVIAFTILGLALIPVAYIFGTPISINSFEAAHLNGELMYSYQIYFGCLFFSLAFLSGAASHIIYYATTKLRRRIIHR